jgi:type I restriction enzyme S subunit
MNHYFEAGKMIPGLMRIAQEGGRAHGLLNIGLPDFFNLPLKLPLKEEQTAIAEVLNTADHEIQLLTTQRDQLKLQKKGLMQQLLIGKKRLKING